MTVRAAAASDRLIVALDLPKAEGRSLAQELQGSVGWMKIGMTLFYEAGPGIVSEMTQMGYKVFVDLKLHDIPHQVEGAAESLARLGVGMVTVHASGGGAMVEAAVRGAAAGAHYAGYPPPAILGVTVLTSTDERTLETVGVGGGIGRQVERLAHLAVNAGATGLVCSPREATAAAKIIGSRGYVVTPGVRPAGSALGDQARAETPAYALQAGATHLVVGRPITQAPDPVSSAQSIVQEMSEALS